MTAPIQSQEFAALMAPLGPFEPAPVVAVGVSGGADSMALALLAAQWARGQGGRAVGLTVDHNLRPESAAEAAKVADWLAVHGIKHHILVWEGAKPGSDIQAAARAARHRLLGQWCRDHGALHLLLAHHRADQAETLLLRLGRGSGVNGLSAMAPIQHTVWGRLLRPFLSVAPERLRATLSAVGQDWVEDPSNRNPDFARIRLRHLMPALAAEGMDAGRLARTAARLGRARAALENACAAAALACIRLEPAGYAWVDAAAFARLDAEIALRLLSRVLMTVGGGEYGPRLDRLESLHAGFGHGGARTLAGCRIEPQQDGCVLVCREAARMAPPVPLVPGETAHWDGRFRAVPPANLPPGLTLGPLGVQGWRKVAKAMRPGRLPLVPAVVRPTLPVVYGDDGISAVPHLGYNRLQVETDAAQWIVAAPNNPLTAASNCLVQGTDVIIC